MWGVSPAAIVFSSGRRSPTPGLFIEVGSTAGCIHYHLAIAGGLWNGGVPQKLVVVLLIHVGHCGKDVSGMSPGDSDQGSIQCASKPKAGVHVMCDNPLEGQKFCLQPCCW